jgi:two-component system phosphate regulon sensor histidine kinase PhoR
MDFDKEIVIKQHLEAKNFKIYADRIHFTNVICNIIENGIKYSPVRAEIDIYTENAGNELVISIKDRGEGMAKKEIKKVFDKFYRIPKGDIHNVKGFGLGLFYVKQICDAHKWKLKLESEPEKGSSFTIMIKQNSDI